MKINNIVVCILEKGRDDLTYGKHYEIVHETLGHIRINNDFDCLMDIPKHRFKNLLDIRNDKINQILY